jgi:hypothetical protein
MAPEKYHPCAHDALKQQIGWLAQQKRRQGNQHHQQVNQHR